MHIFNMSGMAIKGSVPVRNFDAVYIASMVIDNLTHNCKDTDIDSFISHAYEIVDDNVNSNSLF